MDYFPEEITREKCREMLANSQQILAKKVREDFTVTILDAVKKCARNVVLKFDERLWIEHRVTIAKELLPRFGELSLITIVDGKTISKTISSITEIRTNNLTHISIDF